MKIVFHEKDEIDSYRHIIVFSIHRGLCLQSIIETPYLPFAQSVQIRSCQVPKERSPETFRLLQSLPQTWRQIACRVNGLSLTWRRNCMHSSRMNKRLRYTVRIAKRAAEHARMHSTQDRCTIHHFAQYKGHCKCSCDLQKLFNEKL